MGPVTAEVGQGTVRLELVNRSAQSKGFRRLPPDLSRSTHSARATHRKLPRSVEISRSLLRPVETSRPTLRISCRR
jgi:hypothetical protein